MPRKQKTEERMKNKLDLKADLIGNGLFRGQIPKVEGRIMLLVRDASLKTTYIYVSTREAVENVKQRYGKNFIREIGVVKVDTRP